MGDKHSLFTLYGKSPLWQLFASLLVVLTIGSLLFFVFFVAGKLIFDVDPGIFADPSSAAGENDISFLRYILIFQHISFFIVPAMILLSKLKPVQQSSLADLKLPQINDVILVILLAFCTFPVTGFTGQLNSGMHLPDWLSGVERWMTEKEDSVNRLVEIVMVQDNFGTMLLNLLMIALLPAIGEELIFRGVFQKIFYRLFKSGHKAIWVTAFIFSSIHLQFLGFLPRFILGLIFGYLFYWSGTLWLPVISHFVNNAVAVIAAYIQGWDKISELSEMSFRKQVVGLIFPVLICILILLYFRNKSRLEVSSGLNESGLQTNDH